MPLEVPSRELDFPAENDLDLYISTLDLTHTEAEAATPPREDAASSTDPTPDQRMWDLTAVTADERHSI